ncbi:MAG: hypothetical protein DMG00_28270 [Acidobacteria bacterium]|nr:MAG: hypothetical protein DMG00_28270 [Acidobacteriota bacterium]
MTSGRPLCARAVDGIVSSRISAWQSLRISVVSSGGCRATLSIAVSRRLHNSTEVVCVPVLQRRRLRRRSRDHLASMTTSGHNVTMREVRIAELKARLSEYLRAVRRGETIAVLDRETPVAQIVPVRDRTALRIRKPAPGTPPPNRVPLPKRLKSTIDVVQLLLEERQLHR